MIPTSPGVSKVAGRANSSTKPRDLSLLKDPKILSAVVPASQLHTKKESLYLESLYDNPLTPLEYGTATSVGGDISSALEIGLHIMQSALNKQHWACVVDPRGEASSLALFEASTNSPRFVCVRNFSPSRFTSVLSHLVSSMRVVVAHVPTQISAAHMARLMSRVRENNTIMVFLDPNGLAQASFDRRITAQTIAFEGLNAGAGVLTDRIMEIAEYKHGVKISHDHDISLTQPKVVSA